MPHKNPLDPENPDYKPPLPPTFTSIALQGDTVWFGSNGGGLVAFDGSKWRKYTTADGLPDDHVEAVVAQGANIWFTTSQSNRKISKFDGARATQYSTPHVISLSADDSDIWIGSENEIGTYEPATDSLVWYQLPAGGRVLSLLWDGIGVWVAIQQKLGKVASIEIVKFTAQTRGWETHGYFPLVDGETLLAIALDRDVLWGGTSRGDVKQSQLSEKAASRTRVGISPPGAWEANGCIAVDDDFVWFGYGNRGLIRYEKTSGRRESFFNGEAVYGIAVTDEHIWAVTNTGAHRYEKSSRTWTRYEYPTF